MSPLAVCPKCEKLNRVAPADVSNRQAVCGACGTALAEPGEVQELSGDALERLVRASDLPVVVDFWAEWCGPCRMFAPTFKSAARQLAGKMTFVKLNTQRFPEAGEKYAIRGIPTLAVFRNGAEASRKSGALPLPELMEYLGRA